MNNDGDDGDAGDDGGGAGHPASGFFCHNLHVSLVGPDTPS